MEYLVTAKEMKRYDAYTIEHFGIPSMVLMERAALTVVEEIKKHWQEERTQVQGKHSVLVAAGTGNNGGDGLAVGRLLEEEGCEVTYVLAGEYTKCSTETKQQIAIIQKYGNEIYQSIPNQRYDLVIDALFGIGLDRDITGQQAEMIHTINQMKAYKAAIDIPSGIHADTGKVLGVAVKADLTVTFAFWKRGLYLYPGHTYAGRLVCRQIGITKRSLCDGEPEMFTYTEPVCTLMPVREASGNKGTFGKVLIIAGSRKMCGAALLCTESAYRVGAGMVKLVTASENREIVHRSLPEALVMTYEGPGSAWNEELKQSMEWADCIAIGPGLGTDSMAAMLLHTVIACSELPLILDADAINLLAGEESLRQELKQAGGKRTIVLTPHVGELARLEGISAKEAAEHLLIYARRAAEEFSAVVVAKDARTLVVNYNSQKVYCNISGNSGMATAGSGDVLTGILAGLTGQRTDVWNHCCLGVYLHGAAGDMAAGEMGEYAMTAQDMIRKLSGLTACRRQDS